MLATVLFTDIVDSTGRAARAGRSCVAAAPGPPRPGHPRRRSSAGTARSSRSPVTGSWRPSTRRRGRCAAPSACEAARDLGLEIRAGDPHRRDRACATRDVGGIGVHIASRALGEAGRRPGRRDADGAGARDRHRPRFEPLGAVASEACRASGSCSRRRSDRRDADPHSRSSRRGVDRRPGRAHVRDHRGRGRGPSVGGRRVVVPSRRRDPDRDRGRGPSCRRHGGIRGFLTPFPRPLDHARLQVGGAYGRVRHPIYGGLILIALGWSLISSPLTLVVTVALMLVLEMKSRLEESMLAQRFPEYDAYRQRVRWRFVPGVH